MGFNGTSTKTRIETTYRLLVVTKTIQVLMEHPPKQGLKLKQNEEFEKKYRVLMEHPPKQGLKHHIVVSTRAEVRKLF